MNKLLFVWFVSILGIALVALGNDVIQTGVYAIHANENEQGKTNPSALLDEILS